MSATAFQRRRRELKAKEKQLGEDNSLEDKVVFEGHNHLEEKEVLEENNSLEEKEDLKSLKNDELKKLLDEKGIEYDSKAKKEELIKLLEGAE
ncbi:HeH/LEM domain-containing protein [Clostridium sp.]|uniref:HeH/LEM domain-containing protein n=1 Tax=Clostridium sp. TaxID=1506 RepID=UPI001DCB2FB3|nr:HeH/LEM domain-containing protein [Clostridium sp.]MBS5306469.1 hypothetical protein [Clostridium sp.]